MSTGPRNLYFIRKEPLPPFLPVFPLSDSQLQALRSFFHKFSISNIRLRTPEELLQKAEAHLGDGNIPRALGLYKKALRRASAKDEWKTVAHAHLALAGIHISLRRLEEAKAHYVYAAQAAARAHDSKLLEEISIQAMEQKIHLKIQPAANQ